MAAPRRCPSPSIRPSASCVLSIDPWGRSLVRLALRARRGPAPLPVAVVRPLTSNQGERWCSAPRPIRVRSLERRSSPRRAAVYRLPCQRLPPLAAEEPRELRPFPRPGQCLRPRSRPRLEGRSATRLAPWFLHAVAAALCIPCGPSVGGRPSSPGAGPVGRGPPVIAFPLPRLAGFPLPLVAPAPRAPRPAPCAGFLGLPW